MPFCLFIQYAQSIESGDIVSKNILSLYDLEYIYIYVVVLFYTITWQAAGAEGPPRV